MARELCHVSPAGDGEWRVEPEGGGCTRPIFEDKEQAIATTRWSGRSGSARPTSSPKTFVENIMARDGF